MTNPTPTHSPTEILLPKNFVGQAKAGKSMKMYAEATGMKIMSANPPTETVSECPKCKGKGFYTIAVSNPNWPSPDTTTVPCDCVFSEHGQ